MFRSACATSPWAAASTVSTDAADRRSSPCSGGAVPAQDSSNPRCPTRLDARLALRRLLRVVLLAPSLAFLLVLAAAGVASAADGLNVGDAAVTPPVVPVVGPVSTVEPVVARVEPATERGVRTVEAVSAGPARAAAKIVRGAGDKVEAVVRPVAPIAVPPVILPDLPHLPGLPGSVEGPDRAVQSPVDPTAAITSAIAPASAPAAVATEAQPPDGTPRLRDTPLWPTLGPSDATGGAAFGGSGAGSGPWLGHGSRSFAGFAWRSVGRPAVPLSVPRGVTPQLMVPPG